MWTTVLDGISKARRGLCVPDQVLMEVLRFFDVCASVVIRKVCDVYWMACFCLVFLPAFCFAMVDFFLLLFWSQAAVDLLELSAQRQKLCRQVLASRLGLGIVREKFLKIHQSLNIIRKTMAQDPELYKGLVFTKPATATATDQASATVCVECT
jgi:hypothetical protein